MCGGPGICSGGVGAVVASVGKSLSDLVRLTRADVLEGLVLVVSRALRLGELES